MQTKKYVWSWFDGDGVYANEAVSLEEIIVEVIAYYFDETATVSVKLLDEHIEVLFWDQSCEINQSHKFQNSNSAAADFLNKLAKEDGRPDEFAIQELIW